jgi:two-component system sensor histidine kinase MprB
VTFRARLTITAAAAVALAVVLASGLVYVLVREELRSQVDAGLRDRAEEVARIPLRQIRTPSGDFLDVPRPALGDPGYVQVVPSSGPPLRPLEQNVPIPTTSRARAVADGTAEAFLADATVAGTHVRVLTFPYSPGYAVQVTRSLAEVDRALDRIRAFLALIALAGIGVAVALGLVVSRAAVEPVKRLTEATERVTATGDLSERIDVRGRDELSRLAASFNTMLAALETSTRALENSARAQRQLVADASHELRTPLTSLRTNFELLMRERELPAGERSRLLDDVVEQIGEMTGLIAELIELARGDRHPQEAEEVRLDLLAADAVERARRDQPGVTFATELAETTVHGVPASLERAIGNLLDNAAKWSPPGGEVEVAVGEGRVTVRDHGPGIADEDLPRVFDRFYRSPSARTMPGSGLGLAIVRQVAEAHGGSVAAERAEGGGTRVTMRLDGGPGAPAAVDVDLVSSVPNS